MHPAKTKPPASWREFGRFVDAHRRPRRAIQHADVSLRRLDIDMPQILPNHFHRYPRQEQIPRVTAAQIMRRHRRSLPVNPNRITPSIRCTLRVVMGISVACA